LAYCYYLSFGQHTHNCLFHCSYIPLRMGRNLLVLVLLVFLTCSEGRKHHSRERSQIKQHIGTPNVEAAAAHGEKAGAVQVWEGKHGGHEGGDHMREEFWKKFENLTIHFVDKNLPPNVYLVLEDKGIQVRAAYEACGGRSVITRVGIQVADKYLTISGSGKISIDGQETEVTEEGINFGVAKITGRHHFVHVTYGVYSLFMKVKHYDECAHVCAKVGVEQSAKVTPGGFIGKRISVDPFEYVSVSKI